MRQLAFSRATGSMILSCLVSLVAVSMVNAQDSHYWNLQYGTRSTLLGGAVIGSVSDLGATYYNPGALGRIEDPRFLLSAAVYQINRLTIENATGEGSDLKSTRIEPAPSFLAGTIRFKWLKGSRLAYSLLTRQRFDTEFTARRASSGDLLPGVPGDERFAGTLTTKQDIREYWLGLTWASAAAERKLGFGITQYLVYRGQNIRFNSKAAVQSQNDGVAAAFTLDDFDYSAWRLLWKAGISFDARALTLGAVVTTPGLHLRGKGSTFLDLTVSVPDTNGGNSNFLASDFQEGLKAEFRSSWALGLGASYRIGPARLHFSVEWFDSIREYLVIDTKPIDVPGTGEMFQNRIVHQANDVLNYGLGAELSFSSSFSIYGGFVSDFSAAVPVDSSQATEELPVFMTDWDIFHLAAGATIRVRRSEFTLGLAYSFGDGTIPRPVDFENLGLIGVLGNPQEQSKVNGSRMKFVLGFSF